jgi:hypothetical protein
VRTRASLQRPKCHGRYLLCDAPNCDRRRLLRWPRRRGRR